MFRSAKFLPTATDVLYSLAATEPYTKTSVIQNVPIFVRFLSIEPEIIISDNFNSVPCILSEHALFTLMKKFDEKSELKGEFVVIQKYVFVVEFNGKEHNAEINNTSHCK